MLFWVPSQQHLLPALSLSLSHSGTVPSRPLGCESLCAPCSPTLFISMFFNTILIIVPKKKTHDQATDVLKSGDKSLKLSAVVAVVVV